jgi:hypothetical protein
MVWLQLFVPLKKTGVAKPIMEVMQNSVPEAG